MYRSRPGTYRAQASTAVSLPARAIEKAVAPRKGLEPAFNESRCVVVAVEVLDHFVGENPAAPGDEEPVAWCSISGYHDAHGWP